MAIQTFPALVSGVAILYPEDVYSDPSITTVYENRSAEVRTRNSAGAWDRLPVTLRCPESFADTVTTFLIARRLKAEPFYFPHRKRGTVLVRYWSDELPYKRAVSGYPDLVDLELPLRQE